MLQERSPQLQQSHSFNQQAIEPTVLTNHLCHHLYQPSQRMHSPSIFALFALVAPILAAPAAIAQPEPNESAVVSRTNHAPKKNAATEVKKKVN